MAHQPNQLNLLCKWGCEALGPLCVGTLELSSSLDMALFEVLCAAVESVRRGVLP